MCKFFSAIVDDEGKVYWREGLSSHSEIEAACKLRDNGNFAKVELIPINDFMNVDKWEFKIDESRQPDWWNGAFESNVRQTVKDWMGSGKKYTWSGCLNLRGLTSLPAGVKFPEEVSGWLDLRGLTSLPAGVKFPAKSGWLDLSGLTSLPAGVKFPANTYLPNFKK
jgi:hypothetical protein